jgi:preprotein translocase subunit SecF
MIFGGEMIYGFSLALFVGIVFGTISSIYVASTWALILGIKRENLIPVKVEKKETDGYETMD